MILVTGINGFIGSHIARLLLLRGERVRGTIRSTSNLINLHDINDRVELVECDIRDRKSLTRAFANVDTCFHAAALVKIGKHSRDDYFSTNLNGTMNVCEAALSAGVKKFVHTSTCETFRGYEEPLPVTEKFHARFIDMIGFYGQSKFLAEEHVRASVKEGLNAVITVPTAVIGPGDVNLTTPGYMLLEYIKGRIPIYFETGFNIVDVRDVAAGHLAAGDAGKRGKRYILGTHNVVLSDLFQLLRAVSGKKPFSLKVPPSLIIAGSYLLGKNSENAKKVRASKRPFFFDNRKPCEELRWSPSFDLKTTLKDALQWYEKNGS